MKTIRLAKNYWKELLVLSIPVITLVAIIVYNIVTIGANTNGLITY